MHCAYCKRKLYGKGTIEHFYPLVMGGPNRVWNRIIVCKRCNHTKGGHMPEVFVQILEKKLLRAQAASDYAEDLRDMIKSIQSLIQEKQDYFKIKELL